MSRTYGEVVPIVNLEQELDDLRDFLHVDRGLLGEGKESVLLHNVVFDVGRDELQGSEDAVGQPSRSSAQGWSDLKRRT